MIAARYASLLAFAQARAYCPTGPGGGEDNSCGGDRLSVSQKETKDAWGKESYELDGETLKNFSYTLEDKQTGGLASLKVSAYYDYADGDFSPKATEVNIVSWHATPLSEIATHGLVAQESFKGKGFGRAVMKEALRIADEHGATVLSIFAPSDDSQAVMKHYTKTGLLEPILSSKAVYGDYFTSFTINKEKAAEFAKRKTSKRAFCPRGEGNGIDNSCGAKTMQAPDKDGGGGAAKIAVVNKGVKPSAPLSPKNKKSWMAPSGDFYPVASEQTHNAWAVANTSGGNLPEVEYDDAPAGEHLFRGGWLRIADTPDTFYIDTTSQREPSGIQKKNAIDFAIHSGNYDEVLLTNDGWIKKILWSKSDDRAFCPNGTGNGVTNTCGKGIGINDADQDFTGQILSGEKTMETRRPNSLKPYIGKTVGIVRTGKGKATLVGVMKVGEPKFYKTRKEFDADFDKHRVGKDSVHYIGPEGKYGYPLTEVKPVKPRVLSSQGRVARVIAKKVKTRDLLVEFDLDAESPEEPNTESRGDAPAPEKDRVKGSDVNDEGSAKNKSGDISLDEGTISSLKKKVEEHNAAMREAGKPDWTHVRLPSLKAVYRRGAGAFSTSHRPGMTRDQWAMARVNAFLTLARRGRPENAKYTTDNDLLHSSHPKHSGESRSADCGREDDGKFSSGNKCAGSVDMPKEDPRGRMRYDNGVQTDAARKLYQMGSSEKKLKGLVDVMGGDPKSTRVDINPPSLNISVADKNGNKLFHVDLENGRARVYPAKDLTPTEAAKIKEAAGEAFGGRQSDHTIKVFSKAEDMKKWESENAAKIKKWEDKYAFSTLLPPHQRPKKWERSIDAKHASLLAFVQSRGFCPNGEGNGVTNTCSSKESSSREPEAAEPPPSLHLLAERDAEAPQTKIKSGDGEVTVFDRTGISTPDYLDDIECHGRNCGLEVTFQEAKELQPDSDIRDDWSPLDAYVGPGAGYFTGYDGSLGENADGSIDHHGVDYGTIDDYYASDLLAEKQKEVEKEWDKMSDDEKNVASMKLLYGVEGSPPEDEDVAALRASGKKQWMEDNTFDLEESINAMREEARKNAVEQMAKELESAVAGDTIECCLQLYRGLRVDPDEVDRMISSGYVVHENVNSWTTSRDVSRSFGASKLLLVTRKPRVGHIFSSNAHSEMEVVRPPSRMRILGVVRTSTGTVLHVDEDEDYKEA